MRCLWSLLFRATSLDDRLARDHERFERPLRGSSFLLVRPRLNTLTQKLLVENEGFEVP